MSFIGLLPDEGALVSGEAGEVGAAATGGETGAGGVVTTGGVETTGGAAGAAGRVIAGCSDGTPPGLTGV